MGARTDGAHGGPGAAPRDRGAESLRDDQEPTRGPTAPTVANLRVEEDVKTQTQAGHRIVTRPSFRIGRWFEIQMCSLVQDLYLDEPFEFI